MQDTRVDQSISHAYKKLSDEQREYVHYLFHDSIEFGDTYNKLYNVVFKSKPPTPEEFLDPDNGWLSKAVIDSIWPHVREDFLDIMNKKKSYFEVCQYGSTRIGKTLQARLMIIYSIIFIHHLRDPALFYGLSPLTNLAIYFISFKFDKTRQLYLHPIYKYLEDSERFIQVKFQDQVVPEQKKYGVEKIVYSKASTSGEITLASKLQIHLGNDDALSFIGADVLQCYVSEIAFFIEKVGASEEDILRLYTDMYDRINATVGRESYLALIYLDSSANFEDSFIERHIINEIQFHEDAFFRWRARWDVRPQKFPKWLRKKNELLQRGVPPEKINEELVKQGYAFKVISGNGSIPAQLVTDERQLKDVPLDLIIYVPIDVLSEFKQNLTKSIKDIAGKPTSNESKFIQNQAIIHDIFVPQLKNIEGGIVAGAESQPENLIWDQIKSKFFSQYNGIDYIIYRAPGEPRIIGLDIAHSAKGDLYGFCMGHLEYSVKLNSNIVITDMVFPLLPSREGINLSAVEQFIVDLQVLGNIGIHETSTDTFQSEQTVQNLKRLNINATKLSLEKSLNPYQLLLTMLQTGSVKAGKNIFLKNNLACLERKKTDKGNEKVDHPKGKVNHKYFGDWDTSDCGNNEKDVSDAFCSMVYTILNSKITPSTIYEDENKRFSKKKIDQNKLIKEAYAKLHKIY